MNVTERLLFSVRDIWDGYSRHPFVRGIAEGTLAPEKFRYYIIQDYIYLLDYAKVFAIGVGKAKSPEMMKLFSGYVQQITEGEMDIHRGYLGKLGITEKELSTAKASLDNLSYTSYMMRVAYEEGEAEILAAILACAYSYEVIAKRIVDEFPHSVEHPVYGEWIKGYSCDEYSEENRNLLYFLENIVEGYSEKQLKHLQDIFTVCSRYEAAFWDMAWDMNN